MEWHQRNVGGNSRITEMFSRYFRLPEGFANFVYLSQVQQALAIKTAVEHWRHLRPIGLGTRYWQLNDNCLTLLPGQAQTVTFTPKHPVTLAAFRKSLTLHHLRAMYESRRAYSTPLIGDLDPNDRPTILLPAGIIPAVRKIPALLRLDGLHPAVVAIQKLTRASRGLAQ